MGREGFFRPDGADKVSCFGKFHPRRSRRNGESSDWLVGTAERITRVVERTVDHDPDIFQAGQRLIYPGMLPAIKRQCKIPHVYRFACLGDIDGKRRQAAGYVGRGIEPGLRVLPPDVCELCFVAVIGMPVRHDDADNIWRHFEIMTPETRIYDESLAVFFDHQTGVSILYDLHTYSIGPYRLQIEPHPIGTVKYFTAFTTPADI